MKAIAGAMLIGATLFLVGCGGGGSDSPPPDFDVGALLNGQPVAGFDVFPDEEQTLYVRVGDTFELDSSGPVAWTAVVGGTTVVGSGNTILYGGATIQEGVSTAGHYSASTSALAPLQAAVPMTVYATSLNDSSQVARIDIVITN